MKNAIYMLFVLLALLITSCGRTNDKTLHPAPGDTVYLPKNIDRVSVKDPEGALHLCDDAERLGKMCHADAVRQKAQILLRCYSKIDSAAVLIKSIAKDDSVLASPTRRMRVLEMASTLALLRSNFVMASHYSKQGLRLAQELKDSTRYCLFIYNVGQSLWSTGAHETGMREIIRSINLLEAMKGNIQADLYLTSFLGNAMDIMIEEGRLEEAWPLGKRREELNDSLSEHTTFDLDRQKAYCYSGMAHLAERLGMTTEAQSYAQKFEQTAVSKQPVGRMAIVPYLFYSGQYDRLLASHKDIIAYKGKDTVNNDYIRLLKYESIALEKKGNLKASIAKLRNMAAIKDSLSTNEYMIATAHMQERFKTDRLQSEVQEKINQRNILNIIVAVVLSLIAIIIGMFITYVRHSKVVLAKNRKLIVEYEAFNRREEDRNKQFSQELERENRELEKQRNRQAEHIAHDNQAPSTNVVAAPVQTAELQKVTELQQELAEVMSDKVPEGYEMHQLKALRLQLIQLLDEEQLYRDNSLTRAELLRRLNIKDAELNAVLKYTLNGDSLIKVINRIRIKKACAGLKNHPGYTIEAIAEENGFTSLRTFQRTFKEFIGMTSSEYRKAIEEE